MGLYPIALPLGQEQLEGRLSAFLHEGAATLPQVKAFDVLPRGSCAPDEAECLAGTVARAGLDEIISAQVLATERGYSTHLRLYGKDGKLRSDLEAKVQGGPLDLAASLELGVCRLLGAAPCLGELRVSSDPAVAGAELWVDGKLQGPLPLPGPISLTVGRHVVQLGKDEARVRISYGRAAQISCGMRGERPALLDALALSAPAALPLSAGPQGISPEPEPRSRAARVLVASGAALLAASAGFGLYSRVEAHALDSRYQSGALSAADAPAYSGVRTTGTIALALAATGAGALVAGGLVFALAPSGATLFGRF